MVKNINENSATPESCRDAELYEQCMNSINREELHNDEEVSRAEANCRLRHC